MGIENSHLSRAGEFKHTIAKLNSRRELLHTMFVVSDSVIEEFTKSINVIEFEEFGKTADDAAKSNRDLIKALETERKIEEIRRAGYRNAIAKNEAELEKINNYIQEEKLLTNQYNNPICRSVIDSTDNDTPKYNR